MNKDIFRKGMILGIIFLFAGVGVVPSIISDTVCLGKTIYVDDDAVLPFDGSKEHPYPTINMALGVAKVDDTIYVFDGTYKETIIINDQLTQITIEGESREKTIMDGEDNDTVIEIQATNVRIESITIKNGRRGIFINAGYSSIYNCNVNDGFHGIYCHKCSHNNISSNHIFNNTGYGILFVRSDTNDVIANYIYNNDQGIYIASSSEINIMNHNEIFSNNNGVITKWTHKDFRSKIILIKDNYIHHNTFNGLDIGYSDGVVIRENNILFNGLGVKLYGLFNNIVCYNNISNNTNGLSTTFNGPVIIMYNNLSNNGNDITDYQLKIYSSFVILSGNNIFHDDNSIIHYVNAPQGLTIAPDNYWNYRGNPRYRINPQYALVFTQGEKSDHIIEWWKFDKYETYNLDMLKSSLNE